MLNANLLPKFYIGPMTQNVIDSVIEVANEQNIKLGFCVSRRQIDYDYGYVAHSHGFYDTPGFIHYVKSKSQNIIIERDHSGLMQGKKLGPVLYDTHSLLSDARYFIDVIHIDPWKKYNNFFEAIRETINNILYVNSHNKNIQFEVGTEEAIYPYDAKLLYDILKTLKYELGDNIFNNVAYAVVQSGTRLQETKNTGIPNMDKLRDMVAVCKEFGVLSKEHNGDYLLKEEIQVRFNNGLNAINIAPEFGVLETKVLLDNIINDTDFNKIYDICLNGEKWKKWISKDFDVRHQKRDLIKICGHYHNKEIKDIVNIDDEIIKTELKNKLKSLWT